MLPAPRNRQSQVVNLCWSCCFVTRGKKSTKKREREEREEKREKENIATLEFNKRGQRANFYDTNVRTAVNKSRVYSLVTGGYILKLTVDGEFLVIKNKTNLTLLFT